MTVATLPVERAVRQACLPGAETVYERPVKGGAFALMMDLPQAGTPLKATEKGFRGADWAAYTAHLGLQDCLFQVPKLKLDSPTNSLRAVLRSAGMQQPCGDGTDFSELLGKKTEAKLDEVFHAVSFEIDETGGAGGRQRVFGSNLNMR